MKPGAHRGVKVPRAAGRALEAVLHDYAPAQVPDSEDILLPPNPKSAGMAACLMSDAQFCTTSSPRC